MKKLLLIALMLCGFANAQTATVYFDFDSYALSEKSKAKIDSTLSTFKYYADVGVTVQGFTDDAGTPGYNDTLALKRANAVYQYLSKVNPTLKAKVNSQRLSIWPQGTTDGQKRCVVITILEGQICGYRPEYQRRITTEEGVIVLAANFYGGPCDMEVISSLSAEQMIKNQMYGIDVDGTILKTWGMVEIQGGRSDDGFYTVMIPIKEATDPDMTVWLGEGDRRNTRWRNTDIKITTDPTGKYYVMRVPVGTGGWSRINLDKRTNYASGTLGTPQYNKYKIVYVTTDKAYKFNNVNVGGPRSKVGFSAKINDTLYAFTVNEKIKTENFIFNGWEYGKKKPVSFRLGRCTYEQDANNNDYYVMNETTLEKKKTGLWAWLARQFS